MVKELISAYFKENSLVKQHLDSYNRFINEGVQDIIRRVGTIKTNVPGFEIRLGKARFDMPRFYEMRGGYRPILPSEARMRNLTYASPLFLEMIPVYNGIEKAIYSEVFIGEVPVMVKSDLCYLSNMSEEELIDAGEDPLDPGGYFIVNGSERVLVSLEDLIPNKVVTTPEKDTTVIAKVFSTRHGFRARTVVRRAKDGRWYLEFPSTPPNVPLTVVLRVLGFREDSDIEELFNLSLLEIKNDLIYNNGLDTSKDDPVEWLSKKLSPSQPKEFRDDRMWHLIDEYLLPHLGTDEAARKKKALYLARMAERTTRVYHKKLIPDDRDHYGNKRMKIAGDLMEELFRYAFNFLTRDIIYQASRLSVRGRKLQPHTLVRQDALTDRIMYALATGNWIAGQTGVSQLLDRVSWASSLSHRRRVISPLSRKHPHFLARDLHGTHYGKLCPSETPEGTSTSLVKNLSLMAEISTGADPEPVRQFLLNYDFKEEVKDIKEYYAIYLNGDFLGFHKDGESIAKALREKRRASEIDYQVNVYVNYKTQEVFVNTDRGRVRRPYIIVENGKSKLTPELLDRVKQGKLTWRHLLKIGVIEYLDAEEEENTLIAKSPEDIKEDTTHLELEPSTIFGVVAGILPFSNYNSSPRLTMASSQLKQSLGLYAANYNQRFDTKSYIMYYPQQPLSQTEVYKSLHLERRAAGQNFVVAVTTYRGWGMADGVIMNKNAIDRGLGRAMMFKTYETEEVSYPSRQKDSIELPSPKVEGYRGEEYYKHLDVDGIVVPESEVYPRDVLVGKVSPPRFLEELSIFGMVEEKKRENSLVVKQGDHGKVDSAMIADGPNGNKVVKVRLRLPKVPEIGDKFSSRHGQKGVIGLIVPQEDMPFTKDGIVPDLIINPHAIPSRMTSGHLLEMLAGKMGSLKGELIDATPFSSTTPEEVIEQLKALGFDEYGEEEMYDGITGEKLKVKIFIGVIYYQRLHHLVSNKMHARSKGPVQLLTLQPTEGRSREGGLRFGEMERDTLIGYGASMLIRERLLEESDKSIQYICRDCGSFGYMDYTKGRAVCQLCGSTNVKPVEAGYAFKLLFEEIESLGIFPRVIIDRRANDL